MRSNVCRFSILVLGLLALTAGNAFAASAALEPAAPAGSGVLVLQHKAPSPAAAAKLDSMLFEYDVVELPLANLAKRVRTTGTLDIVLAGRLYELELELNDLRADGYKEVLMTDSGPVELAPRPVSTYRGTVRGEQGSVVRLIATRGLFSGYVMTADDWIFIDPLRDYVPGASARAAVVYRESDVRPEGEGLCGVTHRLQIGGEQSGLDDGLGLVAKNHTLRRLQVATEADGQYYQLYGNPGLFNRIQGILNDVDGVYRNQINLYIEITYQQAWSSVSGDPYTSLDAGTSLTQFRNWWNSNRTGTVRDTAHKFSGKDFNGGTIGIAWVGVICNSPGNSYGISQDMSSRSLRTKLTAHEIGHNLSANHDDQIGCSGVSCNGTGPIMCSSIQSSGSNTFSSCSWNSINNHTHSYSSCLN